MIYDNGRQRDKSAKQQSISISVIRRMPRYHRFLGELKKQGIERISSKGLSELLGLTASQIRQDFNCFGGFGQQGYGYNVGALYKEIGNILGVEKRLKTILIGAGNLGKAVCHIDFNQKGCNLIGIFDKKPELIGTELAGMPILDIADIITYCERNKPVVAILCIPAEGAQELVDFLIGVGIRGFWNFSHYELELENRPNIAVENVHLGDSLLTLCFKINNN